MLDLARVAGRHLARERVALRGAEEERGDALQGIIDSSPAAIYVKDPEGRLLLINRRYEQFVHLSRAQVIVQEITSSASPEMADAFAAYDRKAIEADTPDGPGRGHSRGRRAAHVPVSQVHPA